MSAEMANAMWSATTLAQDETTVRAAALSVRQRKLLALLNAPMSVDSLSTMSGLPHPEVETTLARFAKLGLASAKGDAATNVASASPAAFRPSSFSDTAAMASSSSKMPIVIGGVALTAIAAAIWWFTRSAPTTDAPSAPPAQVAATKAPAVPGPAPLAAPGDVSTTNVFVSGSPATAGPTPNTADAAKLAAAAKERETAAREAAKNTKQPANTQPQTPTAATTPPATTPAAPTPSTASAATSAPTPAPAPATGAAPAVAAPPPAAPAPLPAAPAPAPVTTPAPVPTQVAAAPAPRPAAAPPAAAKEGALISRVEPGFPRSAEVDSGTVRARLTVNGTGAVTNVEIVESNPPRVFDRNVRSALAQWRYEGTGETQTKLVEVQFRR